MHLCKVFQARDSCYIRDSCCISVSIWESGGMGATWSHVNNCHMKVLRCLENLERHLSMPSFQSTAAAPKCAPLTIRFLSQSSLGRLPFRWSLDDSMSHWTIPEAPKRRRLGQRINCWTKASWAVLNQFLPSSGPFWAHTSPSHYVQLISIAHTWSLSLHDCHHISPLYTIVLGWTHAATFPTKTQ